MDLVARLAAESAIRELIARTALIGDLGAPEDYASVYAPEAVWEMGPSRQEGLAEIVESARLRRTERVSGPGTNSKHVVTLIDMEFSAADRARVQSHFTFFTSTNQQPVVTVVGSYTDDVEQRDGAWRIVQRVSTRG